MIKRKHAAKNIVLCQIVIVAAMHILSGHTKENSNKLYNNGKWKSIVLLYASPILPRSHNKWI